MPQDTGYNDAFYVIAVLQQEDEMEEKINGGEIPIFILSMKVVFVSLVLRIWGSSCSFLLFWMHTVNIKGYDLVPCEILTLLSYCFLIYCSILFEFFVLELQELTKKIAQTINTKPLI